MVIFLAVIAVVLSILERLIYLRKNKEWNKVRLFVGVSIASSLYLISYYVTDTVMSSFYVFLLIFSIVLVGIINRRMNIDGLVYPTFIVGIPAMIYLSLKAISSMLVFPGIIIVLLFIIDGILSYPYSKVKTMNTYIALGIGLVLGVIVIFYYNKLPGAGDGIMLRQEVVAQEFLKEELEIEDFFVELYDGRLRGDESIVLAYDSSGNIIKMVYKKNQIESYEIGND